MKRPLLDDLRRASPDDVKRALRAMTHTQRELVRAQFERLSFSEFVRAAWPIIDARPLVWNWHLEAMCLHLQLLAEGDGETEEALQAFAERLRASIAVEPPTEH